MSLGANRVPVQLRRQQLSAGELHDQQAFWKLDGCSVSHGRMVERFNEFPSLRDEMELGSTLFDILMNGSDVEVRLLANGIILSQPSYEELDEDKDFRPNLNSFWAWERRMAWDEGQESEYSLHDLAADESALETARHPALDGYDETAGIFYVDPDRDHGHDDDMAVSHFEGD